jgi:hypothetical protein
LQLFTAQVTKFAVTSFMAEKALSFQASFWDVGTLL